MNPEEIKVGETYKIELLCILNRENVIVFETPTGDHIPLRSSDVECVSPANGIKHTEPAPKYDPCRKFREGDIVEPCSVKGRWQSPAWAGRSGIRFTVVEDEIEEGIISVKDPDACTYSYTDAVYFQLVTPVEELEPYSVHEYDSVYEVQRGTLTFSVFYKTKYGANAAKEAAEAECARLNAEYRKEVEK